MKRRLILALCILCIFVLSGCGCEHEWVEASCLVPKFCPLCEDTEGEALGHSWQEADCENPRSCALCNATEGEALGHDWQEADCENPQSCKRCEAIEGEALGHDWQELGCDKPLTCSVCAAENGEPLGHAFGEWAPDNEVMSRSCARCYDVETVPVNHELIGTQWLIGSWTSTYTEVEGIGGVLFNGYSAQINADGSVRFLIDETLEGTWEWDMYRMLDDGTECYDFLTYIENVGFQLTIFPVEGEKVLGLWIYFIDAGVYVEFEKDLPAEGEALPSSKIDNLI